MIKLQRRQLGKEARPFGRGEVAQGVESKQKQLSGQGGGWEAAEGKDSRMEL